MHEPSSYPALTGIRAVAALLVFMHHFGPEVPVFQHPAAQALLSQGHTGVALFFVLSGFLIADRYWSVGRAGMMAFVLRRAGRLLPLYLVLTTATFLIPWLMEESPSPFPTMLFIANITLLRGWFADLWNTGIAQGWSLTAEATFYLVALPIIWTVRRNALALFIIPLALVLGGLLLVEALGGRAPFGFLGTRGFFFAITFPGRSIEFMAGVGLAWALRSRNGLAPVRHATWIGVVACAFILAATAAFRIDYDDTLGVLLLNFLLPLGIAVFFSGLIQERSWVRLFLESGPVQWMGRASYAFYLIHMGLVFQVINTHSPNLLITLIALQLLAWVLYRAIERPCNQWVKNRFPL